MNDIGPAQVNPEGPSTSEVSEGSSLSSSEMTEPGSLEGSEEIRSPVKEVMLNVDVEAQRFIPGSVQIAYQEFPG